MMVDANFNQDALLQHSISDFNRLIVSEEEELSLMKVALKNLDEESHAISEQRIFDFKRRFIIIILFTILFGIYSINAASSITMSYSVPEFYIIAIGSLVWLLFLKYHFSVKLKYQSEAYFEIEKIMFSKEHKLEILYNIRDGLVNLNKPKNS